MSEATTLELNTSRHCQEFFNARVIKLSKSCPVPIELPDGCESVILADPVNLDWWPYKDYFDRMQREKNLAEKKAQKRERRQRRIRKLRRRYIKRLYLYATW